jgi:hypothetical protein
MFSQSDYKDGNTPEDLAEGLDQIFEMEIGGMGSMTCDAKLTSPGFSVRKE